MIATPVNRGEQAAAQYLHKDAGLKMTAENLNDILLEAVSYHQAGQFAEAENLYHNILQADPAQPNANHNLGMLALGADQVRLSLVYFKTALINDPDDPQFWVSYVDALIQAGEEDQARDVLITGLERGLYGDQVNLLVNQLCIPKHKEPKQKKPVALTQHVQIKEATALMHAGKLKAAKEKFVVLLKKFPKHPQILTGLGCIALQEGQIEKSTQLFEQSLQADAHQALALTNLGVCYTQLKRFEAAAECYKQAIVLEPNCADNHFNLGNMQQALKAYSEALLSFQRAIALNASDGEAYEHCASILCELKEYAESHNYYTQAIGFNRRRAENYYGRGLVNLELGALENACEDLKHAIELNPLDTNAHLNFGVTLHKLGEFEQALETYNLAIAHDKQSTRAYNNRGLLLVDMLRFEEALADYDCAIKIDPLLSETYWNKSILSLLRGDFEQGWRLYEQRWASSLKGFGRQLTQPLWLGEQSILGKTLFVHAEQGLGDFIQFCRYIPLLEDMGAKVILEVPSALTTMAASLKGQFRLVEQGSTLPSFDYYCPIMSLPLALKTQLETIPANVPYLFAQESKVDIWQKRLGEKTKPRVGLVCSGSLAHKNDSQRSLSLEMLSTLFDLPVAFHLLQKEIRQQDAQTLAKFDDINTHETELQDFSDTAALIAQMDLVISVDTSVAHLAAAMGKPCWILLPHLPDFRWMLARKDSPWYPSVTLFRQPAYQDWHRVVTELRSALQQVFAS